MRRAAVLCQLRRLGQLCPLWSVWQLPSLASSRGVLIGLASLVVALSSACDFGVEGENGLRSDLAGACPAGCPDLDVSDLSLVDFRRALPPIDFAPAIDLIVPDFATLMRPDMAVPSSCATATDLTFKNGAAGAGGDTRKSTAAEQATCGGNGRELVFRITVGAASILKVTVTGDAGQTPDYVPLVYLRDDCESSLLLHERACVRSSLGRADVVAQLAAGTYFFFVDGEDGTKGIFSLAATLAPLPALPPNDTCPGSLPLLFDMMGHAQASGDLTGAGNDGASGCGGQRGADLVYTFTLKAAQNFAASLAADPMSPNYLPILELRRTCADPTSAVTCDAPDMAGGTAMVNAPLLAAGTYTLWVDSFDAQGGRFKLDAWVGTAPANDSCGGATVLTPVNGISDVPVSTLFAKDDAVSFGCSGVAPDAVYTLNLANPSSLSAWVTPMWNGWSPIVYVRSVCANGGVLFEQACGGGLDFGPAELISPNLTAGVYSIWVDGLRGTWGKGQLSVRVGAPLPPPANDACAGAEVLVVDAKTGIATASPDTRGANGDAASTCGGGATSDVVYALVLAAQKRLTVTLKADPSTLQYHPILYARSSCDIAGTQLACDSRLTDTASIALPRVGPGTTYLWVDGYNTTRGLGKLTVTLEAPIPVPANNGCVKPTALTAGTSITADTIPSLNAMSAKPSALCDPNGYGRYSGNDLTYVYKPVADGTATFSLTPSSTWDAALLITSAMCVTDGSTCTAASDNVGNGSEEQVSVPVQAGVPYYVTVDAVAGQAGSFTLSVR